MIKTPEELTADWKAGKLDWNKFYYIKLTSGEICIDYAHGAYFIKGKPQEITMDYTTDNDVKQILAPVPTYDEYKAIQEELAEHRHYCCCMENEVMRLELAKLEEENKQLRGLLKECLPIASAEIMTWQIRDGKECYQSGKELLTRINEVIND